MALRLIHASCLAAQELCVATQANLNEEASRQERRDAELEELKQLCIETQANMNRQLTTPEGQKDAELAELRELCIQTQAKLCEDAGAEESLRAQLAKKEAELGELTQLCIETQKSLNEQAAEEEKSIAALKEENAELQVRAAQPLARFRPAQSRARACAGALYPDPGQAQRGRGAAREARRGAEGVAGALRANAG